MPIHDDEEEEEYSDGFYKVRQVALIVESAFTIAVTLWVLYPVERKVLIQKIRFRLQKLKPVLERLALSTEAGVSALARSLVAEAEYIVSTRKRD